MSHAGFEYDLAEGFGTRNPFQTESLDIAKLEDKVAGVIPSLAGEHFHRHAVESVQINASVILSLNSPLHDEITLGQIVGNGFVYVANSQWNRFNPDGSIVGDKPFAETVAVTLPLP